MPVQKQLVPLSLQTGLNQKADDFVSTGPANLINGQFVDKTSIAARAGATPPLTSGTWAALLPSGGVAAAPDGVGKRLSATSELFLMENGRGVHTSDLGNGKWRQICDSFNRCSLEARQLYHSGDHVLEFDMATNDDGTAQVIVYLVGKLTSGTMSTSSIFLKIIQNGIVLQDQQVTTAGVDSWSPRVVCCRGDFFVYWVSSLGPTIEFVKFSGTALGTFGSGGTFVDPSGKKPSLHSGVDFNFDVCVNKFADTSVEDIFLAYMDEDQKLRACRCSGSTGQPTTIAVSAVTAHDWTCLRVTTQVGVGATGRSGWVVLAHNATYANGLIPYIADLDAGGAGTCNAGTSLGSTVGHVAVLAHAQPAGTDKAFSYFFDADDVATGSIGRDTNYVVAGTAQFTAFDGTRTNTTMTVCHGVGVAGDPIRTYFNYWYSTYLPVITYSETQSHYNLIEVFRGTDPHASVATMSAQPLQIMDRDIAARIDMNGTFMYNQSYTVGSTSIPTRWRTVQNVPHSAILAPNDLGTSGTKFQLLVNRGNGERLLERGVDMTPLGLDLITVDFEAQLSALELNRAIVFAGGCPSMFDNFALNSFSGLGNSNNSPITELGFDTYPEYVSYSQITGGALADGTYGISFVYEWYDGVGLLHRSAPSPIKNVAVVSGSGTAALTIHAPCLRMTRKGTVKIAMYATEKDGSVLYRTMVTDPLTATTHYNALDNNPNAASVVFKLYDLTGILASDILYTTGGILPNLAYPACKSVALHQDRLFFGGMLEPDVIEYTKTKNPDDGLFPGTHPVLALGAESSRGRVSNLLSLDDKLIVLQERAIGAYFGQGPNDLGLDNQFSAYTFVLSGYGQLWDQSNAVARDPAGFWFKDKRGLRHLGRGLTLDQEQIGDKTFPLGAAVDALAAAPIQGACFHEDNKQTVFAIPGEPALLVFDHEHGQWAQWLVGFNPDVVDPVVLNGKLHFLARTACTPYQFLPGLKTDSADGSAVTDVVIQYETPWIKLADLQGFQRALRLLLLVQAGGAAPPGVFQGTFDSGTGAFADQVINATASAGQVQVGDLLISPIVTPRGAWTVTAVSGAPGAYTITATVNPLFDTLGVAFGTSVTNQGNDITLYCFRPNTVTITIAEYTNYTKLANSFTVGPSSFTATDMTQIEHQITNQKCESIKFAITVDPANAGAPFRLSGLSLLVGMKPGSKFKVPSGNRL